VVTAKATPTAYPASLSAPVNRSLPAAILRKTGVTLILLALPLQLSAREKDASQYGAGLIVNVPFPETQVAQVVRDVIQNGIIRGTKEYNKDEYVSGATAATATRVFPERIDTGEVFYKIRLKALDPRNFKDSGDVGTLAVRYVVQSQGDKNTVLRIDARFVEDFRHTSHASNGSVESAEYKDIHDQLDSISSMQAQTVEAEKEKQEYLAKRQLGAAADQTREVASSSNSSGSSSSSSISAESSPSNTVVVTPDPPVTAASPVQTLPLRTLEERIRDLRQQVERIVKAPGAPLKSAPFHTASTLQSLPAGTEVLIVISTTYWLGVETHDGQHGWMLRDQLELAP
jgi:hypothetical protein